MSITFTKRDKAKVIHLLRECAKTFLFHGTSFENQKLILEHIAHLESQPDELTVNCEFATSPELRSTRFTITTFIGHPRIQRTS